MRKRYRIAWTVLCWFAGVSIVAGDSREVADEEKTALMPLEEVRAGMKGYWQTVVSGTEVQEFPLEVLGVAENFAGPGRSVIICQAVDEENLLSGPVGGMSGSPVFIDGKLIGAYAYGFTWAKEQAIIGVTPIADMLEIFERFDEDGPRLSGGGARFPEDPSDPAAEGEGWVQPGFEGTTSGMPSRDALQSELRPLPMALSVSGFSPKVVGEFEDKFRALGLEPQLVPMGNTNREIDTELKPGSAVAGVLMDGDFSVAGTGTVTYRDGDRILAFGHPFLGMGATDIPMAAAEVLTVVRSVQRSFKLSNTGPVIGAIYQDRLSAIAGRIGSEAPVTRFTLNVENDRDFRRTYQGNLFRHPQLSPLLSTMALAESLTQTMEASIEQTFFLRAEWDIEGYDPIVLEDVSSGPNSPMRLATQHFSLFNQLTNNPFSRPTVNSITYDISYRDEWLITQLESAFIDRRNVKGGETVTLDLVLRGYRDEKEFMQLEVPIPSDLSAETLTLFVGDANSAGRYDPRSGVRPTSLGQVLDSARDHRGRQSVYVKLLRSVPGVSVEGRSMPNLLPSVAASLRSNQSQTPTSSISHSPVWETSLPVDAEFQGQMLFQIEIE